MQNKLAQIIHNLMNAKEILDKATPDADINNLFNENKYRLDALESFSKGLLQNVELLVKNKG